MTRLVFLKVQLRYALRETCNIDESTLNRLMTGVDEPWVKTFHIYAFDSRKLCRAQLEMDIDWNEHNRQLSIGKTTVALDSKWSNNVLIEVEEMTKAFNAFVKHHNLKTEWKVTYTSQVHNDSELLRRARATVGTAPSEKIIWAGASASMNMSNSDFPDLKVGLFLTD
jgi:hypothetical protein